MVVVGSRGSVLVRHVLVQQLRMTAMFTLQGHRVTAMFTPWVHRVNLRLGLGFIRTGFCKWLLRMHSTHGSTLNFEPTFVVSDTIQAIA